ncbi:MAG: thermonuclease family protein [Alphaproteobacteria bacterium]|nr:thermonuclease family protein [Alphaproteobacteria bacterium]
MRKFIIQFLFGVFVTVPAVAVPARVDYIFDGDTFSAQVMLDERVEITVRVRLINIDTPEMNGKCHTEKVMAQSAKDLISVLLPKGTIVELENIKDDKYLGRINANVILPDGRDVGQILIDSGVGRPYSGGKRAGWCEK